MNRAMTYVRARLGTIAWVAAAAFIGCAAPPPAESRSSSAAATSVTLQARIDEVGAAISRAYPDLQLAIAVEELSGGASASYHGDHPMVSASSPKAFWVAAALDRGGFGLGAGGALEVDAEMEADALSIFRVSANDAAGRMVNRCVDAQGSGGDCVNRWMASHGMDHSGFCRFLGGATPATPCPQARPAPGMAFQGTSESNFFTANDSVTFLHRLWDRTLFGLDPLGVAKRAKLMAWMTESTNGDDYAAIGRGIPDGHARTTMMHKSGQLPPHPTYPAFVSHDIGIVVDGPNGPYAIAVLSSTEPTGDYGDELPALTRASCVTWHTLAGDADPLGACDGSAAAVTSQAQTSCDSRSLETTLPHGACALSNNGSWYQCAEGSWNDTVDPLPAATSSCTQACRSTGPGTHECFEPCSPENWCFVDTRTNPTQANPTLECDTGYWCAPAGTRYGPQGRASCERDGSVLKWHDTRAAGRLLPYPETTASCWELTL